MVNAPVEAPLQVTEVLDDTVAVIADGAVIVKGTLEVQRLASVTVTIYAPAVRPVKILLTWLPAPLLYW